MVQAVGRIAPPLLLSSALILAPQVVRADDDTDPSINHRSVEAYDAALANQERLVRVSSSASRAERLARLEKLRANYDRDVHMYSVPTVVAGIVLTALGTAGTVVGLAAEATTKGSSPSWDFRGLGLLLFAVPSFFGGVVPGVIMIRVGTKPVFRPPRGEEKTMILTIGAGGVSGAF